MNPSLMITPNAVKAGKLYSIIPTNGAGDLDVVIATSATVTRNAKYSLSDILLTTLGGLLSVWLVHYLK